MKITQTTSSFLFVAASGAFWLVSGRMIGGLTAGCGGAVLDHRVSLSINLQMDINILRPSYVYSLGKRCFDWDKYIGRYHRLSCAGCPVFRRYKTGVYCIVL